MTSFVGLLQYPKTRPNNRATCFSFRRPCPFVSCRYHLYLDVSKQGTIRLNFPEKDVDELPETCALDVADSGTCTLDTVGRFMNVTRERVRQIEVNAMQALRYRMSEWSDHESVA